MRPLASILLACVLAHPTASAQPVPDASAALAMAGAVASVAPETLDPALPLPPEVWEALASRKHADAQAALLAVDAKTLRGDQAGDRAFLLAWSAIRANKAESVAGLLDAVRQSQTAPEDYRLLTEAELLLASGDAVGAARLAEVIDPSSGVASRAEMLRARALDEAGQTQAAREVLTQLAERDDPAPGGDTVLLQLATKAGLGSDAAYPYLRRLWSFYPTSAAGRRAERVLASQYEPRGRQFRPRDHEIAERADRLMGAWQFKDVTAYLGSMESRFVTPDANACKAWYAYGRSHFKINNVTKASEVLEKAGDKCAGIDEDRGAKSLYIAGKALERKKMWTSAARAYGKIPELYPNHTMADDGFALAGIALQMADQHDRAFALWEQQVDRYPAGDLAAEGFWRLAWTSWLNGNTDQAIAFAERMIWEVPFSSDPVHVMAASYWAARWRIHPNRDDPKARHPDPARVALGIDQLAQLCRDHPTRFYSILAAARLYELAPERVRDLPRPAPSEATGWVVRAAWLDTPAVTRARKLARLGLVAEALVEFDEADDGEMLPGEEALVAAVVSRRNPFEAHDRLHHTLLKHPASTLGADRDLILKQAFPDHYWDEVQQAAGDYGYDPRIFHALVREESSFNERIVSWAGAKGLSQLMPATARRVADWIGVSVNNTTIYDPLTNLRIGSRYLEYLRDFFDGNMVIAVPAYNAGEGNLRKWVRNTNNPPTDELVESIPIRETRHYVKRVLGTYQLYNALYGEGPLYPDWSAHNYQAVDD